jgi:glucose-1-phosphate cytidylyltransferase
MARTHKPHTTARARAGTSEISLADLDVVILCGGLGTRLREETEVKPKPMVEIGGRPILWHIMKIYSSFGVRNFILCLGYKGEIIRDYFLNYRYNRSDLAVETKTSSAKVLDNTPLEDWRVILADTGDVTQTGERIRRVTKYLRHDRFLATYGDGVCDIALDQLYERHVHGGFQGTVAAVHPAARFGDIAIEAGQVTMFREKPQVTDGWVNGGFFVFERAVFDQAEPSPGLSLEHHILPDLARRNQLGAYHHGGFWQCMDTYRDLMLLNDLCKNARAPWMTGHGWAAES